MEKENEELKKEVEELKEKNDEEVDEMFDGEEAIEEEVCTYSAVYVYNDTVAWIRSHFVPFGHGCCEHYFR